MFFAWKNYFFERKFNGLSIHVLKCGLIRNGWIIENVTAIDFSSVIYDWIFFNLFSKSSPPPPPMVHFSRLFKLRCIQNQEDMP